MTDWLKISREKLGITKEEQERRAKSAAKDLEERRSQKIHPGRECEAKLVGTMPFYECAICGRPMDD